MGYLCYATEVKEKEMRIEDIPMVYEFPDVFLWEFRVYLLKRRLTLRLINSWGATCFKSSI